MTEYIEGKTPETEYYVKINFNPKFEREMHGLFDVGRIAEILSHYREEGINWFLDVNRTDGIEVYSSIVERVEEYDGDDD